MTQAQSQNIEAKDNPQVPDTPAIITRPAELSKNLSEMSIECRTDNPILFNTKSEDVKLSTIEKKVKSVFELPQSEVLIEEFPCYIIRLVTLPGWLYLTTNYICFYSSLRGKRKGPYKAGYLSKKNHITSPRTYRHYFELRNHVLSWYESAESKYSPLGSIDLQVITRIEPSRSKKFGIRLETKRHHYTIVADSEVSQKEWIDELKKGSFMAHHSGNSVRIVLPFTRVDSIEKPSVFQFAENIKIRLLESDDPNDPAEEYYFAFFPDIEMAYDQIVRTWKQTPTKDEHHLLPASSGSTSTFTSLEGILGNISPAALPTLLIGKLMSVTNMFNNNSPVSEDHSDDALDSENELESDQMTKIATDSKSLNEKPEKPKRYSLLFKLHANEDNETPDKMVTSPESLSPPLPPDHPTVAEDENQKKTKHHSRHSLGKIPAAVKDVIKHQVLRTEDDTPSNTNQSPPVRRNRGSSFNTIRQISLSPFTLHIKKNSESNLPPSNEISQELTVKPKPTTRHNRASSIGSFILNSGSKTLGKLSDHYYKNDEQHHLIWVNRRVLKSAEQHPGEPYNLLTKLSYDDMMPDEIEEIQQSMNEQLNNYFPMLLQSEPVQAAVRSSFWRTIPYSGKIFMTDKYFCFHSRVLAGQQRLIFPWSDVITVQRIISKNYFLYCGMTMTIKNMTEEIYFDFSTVELRDQCYALCLLKSTNINDTNSIFSRESTPISVSGSSIILDRPEHISPPLEYDGPPLFSSSSNGSLKYYPPSDSLHITCLTIGSRGDVQPYIALCKELIKEGHTCRIATHAEYKDWIEGHDIEFRSIGGDPGELMKLCIDNSFLSVSFIREGTKFFYKWFEDLLVSSYEACIGTDLIIESPSAMVGVHTAEKLEIPYFRSMPFPFSRTAKFPHPFAMHSGSRIYNDMTYVMIDMALWTGTSKIVNRFRRKHLGLPSTNLDKLELWKVPYLYSFSPSVVHPPKDWPDYIHCTGYWFLDNPDQKWKPDIQLVRFLELADLRPIVYIGFGSIIVSDAVEVTRTIIEAVLKANVRAIICKGWSSRMDNENNELSDKSSDDLLKLHPETIYQCDSVPHDWLFPKIQGVVHHGGAGTTAAGLRAGLPTIIKPFFGDQRFWSQRVEELQVGLCLPKLTKDKLSEALIKITQNKVMIKKAEAVGKSIRQENGTKVAIECIYREFNYAKQLRIQKNGSHHNNNHNHIEADDKLIESESEEEEEVEKEAPSS